MAASLSDLLTALQNGVQAMNAMTKQIASTFPQASTVSTGTVSAGTITFTSSQASAFLTVVTSSGFTYKMALYPSS